MEGEGGEISVEVGGGGGVEGGSEWDEGSARVKG